MNCTLNRAAIGFAKLFRPAAVAAALAAATAATHGRGDEPAGVGGTVVENSYLPAPAAQHRSAPAALSPRHEPGPYEPAAAGYGPYEVQSGAAYAPHAAHCGCTACVDPYQPSLQTAPPSQPVGLHGCACESCIRGIDCAASGGREQRWHDARPINFQPLRHGEWIGPVRLPSMLQYRVRVGDELQFVFVNVHDESPETYQLMVGDEIAVRSVTDENVQIGDVTRGVTIQPDGLLHLQYIGAVHAAGMTIEELRGELEERYSTLVKNPAIDVIPVKTNTKLQDLNLAVSNFLSAGGQNINAVVSPDGRIQLPIVGNIRVVGMTLEEVKREVNLQYRGRDYWGIEVEPRLAQQAQHFVYVAGEVNQPGRFELTGPTSVTQALAMAQGIRVGGNMRQVVVIRRAEDWRILATMLDLRGEQLGKRPNPADEIWLRDSDMIIVPPQPIKVFNNWVKMVFTDGVYGVAPSNLFINGGSLR